MNLKEKSKHFAAALGKDRTCGVQGCETNTETELIWLKPFDPIDHEETPLVLCPTHQQWADERNAVAEVLTEELREFRKELGKENIEKIQSLAQPDDGKLSEEYLMGEQYE